MVRVLPGSVVRPVQERQGEPADAACGTGHEDSSTALLASSPVTTADARPAPARCRTGGRSPGAVRSLRSDTAPTGK